jgi:hypothetical protein
MPTKGPLELAIQIATILDELNIEYALGGSLASSLVGEPRSTIDVDMATKLDSSTIELFLNKIPDEFYIPDESVKSAIKLKSSFNLIDTKNSLKIDIFIVDNSKLDVSQIERRILIDIPEIKKSIWVTSPEDQILRKLDWYRLSGGSLEKQIRDVIGILNINKDHLDFDFLHAQANNLGMSDLLDEVIKIS